VQGSGVNAHQNIGVLYVAPVSPIDVVLVSACLNLNMHLCHRWHFRHRLVAIAQMMLLTITVGAPVVAEPVEVLGFSPPHLALSQAAVQICQVRGAVPKWGMAHVRSAVAVPCPHECKTIIAPESCAATSTGMSRDFQARSSVFPILQVFHTVTIYIFT
jgi:hypothetical protein